jgi:chromosomal replication initiator protein
MSLAVAGPVEWDRVKKRLRVELGEEVFASWFARVELEAQKAGTVHLSVPTRFLKNWLQSRYRDRLIGLCNEELGGVHQIEFSVRTGIRSREESTAAAVTPSLAAANSVGLELRQIRVPSREPVQTREPVAREISISQSSGQSLAGQSFAGQAREAARPVERREADAAAPVANAAAPLDHRYTFENFIEGKSNSIALAAARRIADSLAGEHIGFNPLFIHAQVGLGKTHLLQAVASRARANGRRVVYLTAEHFMYRFVAALKHQSAISFKEELRATDLLLIDDLQFLQGRQVQQEFCHTLNSLIDGARQVVVAADRPPVELEMLDERVRSRLAGGLLVEVGAPDLELRRRIVETRVAASLREGLSVAISPAVIDFVAENIVTNGRDLDGAVTRLIAHSQFSGEAVTVDMAEAALRDLIRVREARRVKIEDIQRIVCKQYNVSKADLLSSRRTRTVVRPRQIAMYLAKVLTPRSLPEIGRRFGNRDHTTVLHAVRKIEDMVKGDRLVADEIDVIRRQLDI